MQDVASRLGFGAAILMAAWTFGTAQAAPANSASPAATSTHAAMSHASAADHRAIGGQTATGGTKFGKDISEEDCLNGGGKVIRNASCSGTRKMCETSSKDHTVITAECIEKD
jgi:hypothetical protein